MPETHTAAPFSDDRCAKTPDTHTATTFSDNRCAKTLKTHTANCPRVLKKMAEIQRYLVRDDAGERVRERWGAGRIGGKGEAGPGEGSGAAEQQDGVCLTTVRRDRRVEPKATTRRSRLKKRSQPSSNRDGKPRPFPTSPPLPAAPGPENDRNGPGEKENCLPWPKTEDIGPGKKRGSHPGPEDDKNRTGGRGSRKKGAAGRKGQQGGRGSRKKGQQGRKGGREKRDGRREIGDG